MYNYFIIIYSGSLANLIMSKKPLERIAGAPADALEDTIETSRAVAKAVQKQQPVRRAKGYWNVLGPGLTTGASDDDPSGIATYSQAGAKYGFNLLWLAAFTFPLMSAVQEMCARIGIVTGRGLASNIRLYFPRWVLYLSTTLLFTANTFNIGADLGALAEAMKLFIPDLNYFFLVSAFAILILAMEIFFPYERYARHLKWLALVLILYVITTFLIRDFSWTQVLKSTFVPHLEFTKDQIFLVCAILGTTISPYLFFWQTSQEVEREIAAGKDPAIYQNDGFCEREIKKMRIDVWSGMFFSNLAMFFIIAACAATLNATGITNINTAAQAANALRPLAGDSAYALFAIGILGVGLLGVPILAGSSSYAMAETFGWKEGLHYKLKQANAFYGVIIFSVVIGLALNFLGIDPIKALIYAAVLNGVIAPVILVLIVLISSKKEIMGRWTNGPVSKTIGWIATILMVLAGTATIISIFV